MAQLFENDLPFLLQLLLWLLIHVYICSCSLASELRAGYPGLHVGFSLSGSYV